MDGFRVVALVAAVSFGALSAQPASAGDAAAGKKVWNKCKVCHTLEPDKHKQGPSLHGVIGRTAGTVAGTKAGQKFPSDAMKMAGEKGLVWNEETIAAYVTKDGKKTPKTFIREFIGDPKAKVNMVFPGLKKPEDVDNLIAYIVENSQ